MSEGGRLELRHPGGSTPIWVGAGALGNALEALGASLARRRVFAVTSPPVRALHGAALDAVAATAGAFRILEVADGESAKSVETVVTLWRRLLDEGGKRDSLIVAFGGGSIGDVAGFVAATFLRGVDYLQVPTTLLAQVDASIGGKTAINLPRAKNCVGAFHHPVATIAETTFLETLGPRQIRCGLFEVVKTAAMLDSDLFAMLETELEELLGGGAEVLAPVVEATAAAKIAVVERDPTEGNDRRLLNFGHTLGHALESAAVDVHGHKTLEHGEAVGYGMLFALELARPRGLGMKEAERIRELVVRIGLPPLPGGLDPADLIDRIARDKKAREGSIAWVMPMKIGDGLVVENVTGEEVSSTIDRFLAGA
jgi:3-dehydroquinate synthase